jgi:hypothetical protein
VGGGLSLAGTRVGGDGHVRMLVAGRFALVGFAGVGSAGWGGRSGGIVEGVGGGLNLAGTGGICWSVGGEVGRKWRYVGVVLVGGGVVCRSCCLANFEGLESAVAAEGCWFRSWCWRR